MLEAITPYIIIAALACIFIIAYLRKGQSILYCLLIATGTCLITAITYGIPFENIVARVAYKPLIILITINIIIAVVDQKIIFEYAAIQIIKRTKNNLRLLFYTLCIVSAVLSIFLEDVAVAIILVPLIIKTSELLEFDPVPFITGAIFSIITGNLLAAFSSPSTILISDMFNVTTQWFFETFILLFIIVSFTILFILDMKQVRRMKTPDPSKIEILVDMMDTHTMIADPRSFKLNVVVLFTVFTGLIILPMPIYLFLIFATMAVCIIKNKSLGSQLKKADWDLILFIMTIFLMSVCLDVSGLLSLLTNAIASFVGDNIIISVLIIIMFCAAIGSFLHKAAAIVIAGDVARNLPLFATHGNLLIIALTIGTVLGGNLIPQSASHILKTMWIAQEKHVDKVNQKMLLKNSFVFMILSIGIGFVYSFLFI